MTYPIRNEGAYSVISLDGEIDLTNSPLARAQILAQLGEKRHVLVDLSSVAYIDSSGIASLIEGLQQARINELRFGLVGISKAVKLVIQLARLDQVFSIYNSVEEATVS